MLRLIVLLMTSDLVYAGYTVCPKDYKIVGEMCVSNSGHAVWIAKQTNAPCLYGKKVKNGLCATFRDGRK